MTNEENKVSAEAEVQAETVGETAQVETEKSEVALAATDEVVEDNAVEADVTTAQGEEAYAPRPSDGQPV